MASKHAIRERASEARRTQADKDETSRVIIDRATSLPPYTDAAVVMWYVDVRNEVRTRHALPSALASGKTIVIPYCVGDELALFRLESMHDLSPGKYGILEPNDNLRESDERAVAPDLLEAILVPGVAFDIQGGRLGHGKGYYDRLLSAIKDSTVKIGIAYDCQMVDQVPTEPHDVAMNMIVTESLLVSML